MKTFLLREKRGGVNWVEERKGGKKCDVTNK
jgi:hypothetical protein